MTDVGQEHIILLLKGIREEIEKINQTITHISESQLELVRYIERKENPLKPPFEIT